MASKKAAEKKAAPEFEFPEGTTRESLEALGEDLNKAVFATDDDAGLDYATLADEELVAQLKEDMAELKATDALSDESKETLAALGCDIKWKTPKAAKKAEPAKQTAAATGDKKPGVPRTASPESIARKAMIKELIEAGKWTGAEILAKVMKKFPESKESGTRTILSDSKNEKYTAFGQTAKVDAKGIFSF